MSLITPKVQSVISAPDVSVLHDWVQSLYWTAPLVLVAAIGAVYILVRRSKEEEATYVEIDRSPSTRPSIRVVIVDIVWGQEYPDALNLECVDQAGVHWRYFIDSDELARTDEKVLAELEVGRAVSFNVLPNRHIGNDPCITNVRPIMTYIRTLRNIHPAGADFRGYDRVDIDDQSYLVTSGSHRINLDDVPEGASPEVSFILAEKQPYEGLLVIEYLLWA